MKSMVVDASVIVKWIFPERVNENHLSQALHLLQAIRQSKVKIIQPPHWLVETAAVVVRLQPKIAEKAISLLTAMDFPIIDEPEIYTLACRLAERYHHHLFDTLYHAVAIYSGNAQFITADEKYYRKAIKSGAILYLENFSIFDY